MSSLSEGLRALAAAAAHKRPLVERLRIEAADQTCAGWHRSLHLEAAKTIDALTARVAQLEACLTDTLQQLEAGGVKE